MPHGIAVVTEGYTEEEGLTKIRCEIICEKPGHKKIIIGKGGELIKRVGTYAREELEKVTGGKVYLDLWVKVKENWRDREGLVRTLGYDRREFEKKDGE